MLILRDGELITYKTEKLNDLFKFEKKSKIKAGEGLDEGKYKFFTSSPIQSKFLEEYTFDKESLIFGTGGQPSVHYCNEKFSTSTDCFVIYSTQDKVIPKYVYYYLLSNMNILERGFKGAGLKHISKKYLQNIDIIYPTDISQQKKIINKLTVIEELISLREKSIKLLEFYLNSLFEKLFLNKDFKSDLLKNHTSLITSGSTPKGGRKNYTPTGDILFIRSQNVLMNKFSNHDALYISMDIHNKMKRTWLKTNDVLLNITGASIGRTVVYEGSSDKANLNQHVCIIRLRDLNEINPIFLNYYLSSNVIQRHIKKVNAGATREALNFTQIGNFKIIIPPIDLQNSFSNTVMKIRSIEKKQIESKNHLQSLFSAIMQNSLLKE